MPINDQSNESRRSRADKGLDDALEGTFPASDPLAFNPRRAGRDDHKVAEPQPHGVREWWRGILARMAGDAH